MTSFYSEPNSNPNMEDINRNDTESSESGMGSFLNPSDLIACQNICHVNICTSISQLVGCVEEFIFPTPLEWLLISMHLMLFSIGVVGNFLVCFVVLRSKHMQTVTNLFIVNLAGADAVVLVLCSPPTVLQEVTETWYLGETMCKVVIFFQNTVVGVSVLTLSAIAVERYFAICRPLKSRITLRKVTITILIIWIVSATLASPNLNNRVVDYFSDPALSGYLTSCDTNLEVDLRIIYNWFIIITLYIVPMIIIAIFYLIISHHLWHVRVPGTAVRTSNHESNQGYRTHAEVQLASRKKVAKMLIAIVLLFAACYFPINLIFILRQAGVLEAYNESSILPVVFMCAHLLCYINSAFNPLIYNFMSVKFKKEFRNVFSCMRRENTPLHHESTWFHSTRMVRQPTNNSNHSASRILRVHDVTYPALTNHRVIDNDDLDNGESV
ncbi:orexin/Hypocretin receptor type 1-like [Physella acuta]|uniref:orexin/Hypocretin receptor type 1-like n=1 Tax=Physella acuta TaxID=109671 RepID=UPI0027DD271B|nr:orexin/Hypocretin receptor type 1-like [Physella acuta]